VLLGLLQVVGRGPGTQREAQAGGGRAPANALRFRLEGFLLLGGAGGLPRHSCLGVVGIRAPLARTDPSPSPALKFVTAGNAAEGAAFVPRPVVEGSNRQGPLGRLACDRRRPPVTDVHQPSSSVSAGKNPRGARTLGRLLYVPLGVPGISGKYHRTTRSCPRSGRLRPLWLAVAELSV